MNRSRSESRPDLSIVIPAYREAKRIGSSLEQLAEYIKQDPLLKSKIVELVVVAAEAGDNTKEVVLSKSKLFEDLKVISPGPRVGKGRDVKVGMLAANGEAVVFMDADLATPLKYLTIFYQAFLDGADMVVATRNLKKHHPNLIRRGLSNIGNLLFRISSGVKIEDTQCGFKLFSRAAAQLCFSKMTILGWGFDMEVLSIAKANNVAMKTIRVNDWHHVPGGTFGVGIIRNSLVTLLDLARIGNRRYHGRYKED